MARTQAERLDELGEKLVQLTIAVERSDAARGVELAQIKERLREVEALLREFQQAQAKSAEQNAARDQQLRALDRLTDHPATLAAHDQRLKALEKGTDRVWQLLPVAVSAVALLVAAYVAFAKK